MNTPAARRTVHWPLVALALIGAAWLTFALMRGAGARLNAEWLTRRGPDADMADTFNREAFVSLRLLPYCTAMLVFDALAAVSLAAEGRRRWLRPVRAVAAIVLVPTAILHALMWVVVALFAS